MRAFDGNPAVKAQLTERLEEAIGAGRFAPDDPDAFAGVHSVVAVLAGEADARRYEEVTGIPGALGLVLDHLVRTRFDDRGTVRRLAREWLAVIAPGADLGNVPGRLAVLLLEDGTTRDAAAEDPAVLAAVESITTFHRAVIAGETVTRQQWSAARAAALQATDSAGTELAHGAGALAEALAWDPRTSRTILHDAMGLVASLRAAAAVRASGWSDDDRRHADALMQALWAETAAQREATPDSYAFPPLFAAKHPAVSRGFRAALALSNSVHAESTDRIGEQVLDLMRNAPRETRSSLRTIDLIPRRHLFGNPTRSGAGISPDGAWLCWVAPLDGVMNLWVAPRERLGEARAITADTDRGISGYSWSYDSRYLLFSKDTGGDENWHVHAVAVADGTTRDLTPFDGAQCGIAGLSKHLPTTVLISSNARDPRHADLIRIDLDSGTITPVIENPGFAGFMTDEYFVPKLAMQPTPQGGMTVLRADGEDWRSWIELSPEDARTSGPSHFDASGETLFFFDSRSRDTAALVAIDLRTEVARVLAEHERADIGGAITDIASYWPLAYSVTVERHAYHVLDERIRGDIDFLDAADIGDWSIMSRSLDDRWWTVGAASDVRPGVAWLYDREARTLKQLYESRPELMAAPLARMRSVTITARDGLPLVSYVTLPVTADAGGETPRASTPQPMVLSVHGGPWMRDTFGFDAEHQWLANRGYAVLSVNFRASSGFGKRFLAAGDGEWGGRMDDDLTDAVAWAIEQGIADPARIAIMGGSYGGYATLAGLSLHPELYACGVDIVGPSNLETLMDAIPPYWESERITLYRAVGDPRTEEGCALLRERSPLHRAGAIRRPLLIGQGSNDPRVKQAESDQMVAAMEASGVPVTYVVYPDEGHGFHRPPNRVSFNAIVEAFLSHHLGGALEPVHPDETRGATYELRSDVDWLIPLLPERLG